MAAPAVSDTEEVLEVDDIQGLVVRSYHRFEARFLLLLVQDAAKARAYLGKLADRINAASERPETFALQIAFTGAGLRELEVPKHIVDTFARELTEGMDQTDRADALGDRDLNDPSTWDWGHETEGTADVRAPRRVHAMLMVYALDNLLETHVKSEKAAFEGGFTIVREKFSKTLPEHREHFGWRDGLSMPKIAGVPPAPDRSLDAKPREWWTTKIPPGEFVLGYRNDYSNDEDKARVYTESPTVSFADDPANLLSVTRDGTSKDLGRNGTYLVYREMTQDVHAFWSYLAKQSREGGVDPAARAIALGAKMVGRWPNGAPMTTSPASDDPARRDENAFLYAEKRPDDQKDFIGVGCPRGAHIRRANPRDVLALEDRDAHAAEMMARKHQMVRRGRPFGEPVSPTLDPREMIAATPDGAKRGLHFICLVGDINRQFEFVQRAWIHSGNFDSMYKDGDPISGARRPANRANPNDEFTCPAIPVRRKYREVPQFSTLVGGAYFFLPGLRALRFFARVPSAVGAPA
ncbi:MAG: Dyp-type peroxidase [Kofleriaceae bacterium]